MNPDNVKDTSEPAFPALAHWDRSSQMSTALQFSGMTLRDYFAAKALQGLLSSDVIAPADEFARQAYTVADAMLKAREA